MLPPSVPSISRLAIYTRQSLAHDDEFSSCDAQFEICQEFITANRPKGWVWCGQRYDDAGQSGERLNRPGLTQLNPVYRGQIHTANGPAPGTHEAIITDDLFDRVREVMAGRRVSTTPCGKAVFAWPLRGVVVCGRCGRTMSTSVIHHRHLRYRHYRCRSHAGGRPPCKGAAVPAHELEQWVIRELNAVQPERFRNSERRQEVTDFRSLWGLLTEKEQIENLAVVVEQVRFDPIRSKIQLSLRAGAVGAVAGIIAKREQGKEPEPRSSRRKCSPADKPAEIG